MTRGLRLVGSAEIRAMLGGVYRQRVYQITSHRSFPEPVAHLQMGNVWLTEDVEAWLAEHRPGLDES
ncbi:DNA-binding protein [Micromonospora yangpuensis]|nr:DNA-binding protein [Micromonospora yangpuensis]GGM26615.1 hypothetical protein GCM10012279_51300 [Micromonospora yangpuensis]